MRATNGAARHRMIKRIKKRASGYYSGRHKMYRVMCEALRRADVQAFASRKQKKRTFRGLWIKRISIACRDLGITYSRLISGLQKADIRLDRKQLSELAIHQPEAFKLVIEQAAAALKAASPVATPTGIKGYFEIVPTTDSRFYFNLKAGNHEIILTGSPQATAVAAKALLNQVRAVAANDAAYVVETAKNGEVFFNLVANGVKLGHSETYPTQAVLHKGQESVKRNGLTLKVIER